MSATPANAAPRGIMERLRTMDRRWLFLCMGLAIVLPIFFPIGLPALPGDATVDTYDAVASIKDGSRVFMSIDFDPASRPELEPFAKSVLVQLKRKRCKIVIVSLWEYAPPLINGYIRSILQAPLNPGGPPDDPLNKIYERKTDFIFLGFKSGKQAVINTLGQSLPTAYPTTQEGEPVGTILHRIPLSDRVFDAIVMNHGPYAPCLQMARALETDDASAIHQLCTDHEMEQEDVNRILLRTLASTRRGTPA